MNNKMLYIVALFVILSLTSIVCFAADNTTVNLGNEITRSMDKTSDSFNKVVTSNIVTGTRNVVEGGIKSVENVVGNAGNMVKDEAGMIKDETRKMEYNDNNKNDSGNYNAVRTGATDVSRSGIDKDTMTTWMWITLIAATTIIIAAIWYYVTQTND